MELAGETLAACQTDPRRCALVGAIGDRPPTVGLQHATWPGDDFQMWFGPWRHGRSWHGHWPSEYHWTVLVHQYPWSLDHSWPMAASTDQDAYPTDACNGPSAPAVGREAWTQYPGKAPHGPNGDRWHRGPPASPWKANAAPCITPPGIGGNSSWKPPPECSSGPIIAGSNDVPDGGAAHTHVQHVRWTDEQAGNNPLQERPLWVTVR